jgi:hypothetical protein
VCEDSITITIELDFLYFRFETGCLMIYHYCGVTLTVFTKGSSVFAEVQTSRIAPEGKRRRIRIRNFRWSVQGLQRRDEKYGLARRSDPFLVLSVLERFACR